MGLAADILARQVFSAAAKGDPSSMAAKNMISTNAVPMLAGVGTLAFTRNPGLAAAVSSSLKVGNLNAQINKAHFLKVVAQKNYADFERLSFGISDMEVGADRDKIIKKAGAKLLNALDKLAASYESSVFTPRDAELANSARFEHKRVKKRVNSMLSGAKIVDEDATRVRVNRTRTRKKR